MVYFNLFIMKNTIKRLERIRSQIRRIKDYPNNYKQPKECLTHLTMLEMQLEDQMFNSREAKSYS